MVWHDCHCSNMKKKYFLNIYPKISGNDQIDTKKKDIHRLNGIWCKYMFKDGRFANLPGKENSYNPPNNPSVKKNPRFFVPKTRLIPSESSSQRVFFLLSPPNIGKEEQTISSLKVFQKNGENLSQGLAASRRATQTSITRWRKKNDQVWKLKTTIK